MKAHFQWILLNVKLMEHLKKILDILVLVILTAFQKLGEGVTLLIIAYHDIEKKFGFKIEGGYFANLTRRICRFEQVMVGIGVSPDRQTFSKPHCSMEFKRKMGYMLQLFFEYGS